MTDTEETENPEEIIFTRYLYILDEVRSSLLLSILNRNADESLFWGYELYYSGYTNEVIQFVFRIYNELYQSLNPNLQSFIEKQIELWRSNNDETVLGTLIYNLLHRKYCVSQFLENYSKQYKNLDRKSLGSQKDRKFYILLEEKDIAKYKTPDTIRPGEMLKTVSVYTTHKYMASIFWHIELAHEELIEKYQTNWLYHASFSKIWKDRIAQYDGYVDESSKNVVFTGDNEEEFMNKYNYEPDEQSMDVTIKHIGNGEEKQWNWEIFYNKYFIEP